MLLLVFALVIQLPDDDQTVRVSTAPRSTATVETTTEVVPSAESPLAIDKVTCEIPHGGSGECSDGVTLGTSVYAISCAAPRESDLDAVVGVPGGETRFVEARAIAGEDPAAVIALRTVEPLASCQGNPGWVLAFGGSLPQNTADDARRIAHLLCEVPEVPDDPRCVTGGPFSYYLDPSVDGTC